MRKSTVTRGEKVRKGTQEEWLTLGEKVRAVKHTLSESWVLAGQVLPIKVYRLLGRAAGFVDEFCNIAEEEMWLRGGPKNISVFYGEYDKLYDSPQKPPLREKVSVVQEAHSTLIKGDNMSSSKTDMAKKRADYLTVRRAGVKARAERDDAIKKAKELKDMEGAAYAVWVEERGKKLGELHIAKGEPSKASINTEPKEEQRVAKLASERCEREQTKAQSIEPAAVEGVVESTRVELQTIGWTPKSLASAEFPDMAKTPFTRIPRILVRLKVYHSNGRVEGWGWEFAESCPFCGDTHTHGGGDCIRDDPRDFLGRRQNHCVGDTSLKQYYLIDSCPDGTAELIRKIWDA